MAGQVNPISILLGLLVAPQLLQGLTSVYPPFQVQVARKGFGQIPNVIPGASELASQVLKGILDRTDFISLMREAGYSPNAAENILANQKSYLSALDYITVWRRGNLGEGTLNEKLKEMGLQSDDIAVLKDATIYYPTPQDLVRFGVRDVFTSETVSQYGLNEDYPDQLDSYAIKAGLTPEISRQYWAAHWELPSPTQVYDMYHRKIITKEQMLTYLKVADYMPFWRDKLEQLSFDPLTRVDVKRMYIMGVLSETEVNKAYQDLGYSPHNAELLTRYTVLEKEHTTEKTPSTGAIAAYKAGVKNAGETLMVLMKAGLPYDSAQAMIDTADADLKQELIDLEADAIVDNYQRGHISMNELQAQLTKIGVPARTMQLTIQRELAQARRRAKVATKSDLDSWWRKGVIGTSLYESKLRDIGYVSSDIPKYLAELRLDELIGADKKYPYAEYTRDYSDGLLTEAALRSKLTDMGIDEENANTIVSIVSTTKT